MFVCFSAAALLSPRRQYLYLGGILSSVLTTFMWMRLGTWVFGGSAALFQAELYVGLAVFSGYVVRQGLGWEGGREGAREGCAVPAAAAAPVEARALHGLPPPGFICTSKPLTPRPSPVPRVTNLRLQVYDTQMVVERFEAGEQDTLRHALDLFVDFAAIFVRLLVILLRNAEAKAQREREREARSGGRQRGARTTRL